MVSVTPLLTNVVAQLMAFPRGLWREAWEFEDEAQPQTAAGLGGGSGMEREGEGRHAVIKAREELGEVLREAAGKP